MLEQIKKIAADSVGASGRGGFLTATVTAIAPLAVTLESGLQLIAADLYITDNCIGLTISLMHTHTDGSGSTGEGLKNVLQLRRPLQVGDGVLLLSRPESADGTKYILLDRVQPYISSRGVTAT